VVSKLKYSYQISKLVNACLILLEVLVSHTVKVRKYHTNCRLWKFYPLLPFQCW